MDGKRPQALMQGGGMRRAWRQYVGEGKEKNTYMCKPWIFYLNVYWGRL